MSRSSTSPNPSISGARVVPITPADFDRVHTAVLRDLNPRIERDRWRRIFEWGWTNPEDHVGFALVTESGDFVGYAGTIYRDHEVGGRVERFCNITSWIVKDGHRSSALALVMPVLRRRDLTITNLTSLETVNDMFRKLGFETLETHTRVFLPWERSVRGATKNAPRIHLANEDRERLPDPIARDVDALGDACHHWVVEDAGRWCHLAFTIGRRRRLRTLRIHHLSDPELFVVALPALRRIFRSRYRALLAECDDRLVRGFDVPGSRGIPLPVTRLFRSPSLEARQISNLYSELPLLNL